MAYTKYCLFVFSLVYFATNIAGSTQYRKRNGPDTEPIDVDYFFGRSSLHLRTTRGLRCPNCVVLCESENYACHDGNCLCAAKIEEQPVEPDTVEEPSALDNSEDDQSPVYLSMSDLTGKPALRHHIAHFCPNLDIARKCIRSCMQVGKPAFCGKDHKCYCGHKYTSHDVDPIVDPEDIHAKFRDLYNKYFGTLNKRHKN